MVAAVGTLAKPMASRWAGYPIPNASPTRRKAEKCSYMCGRADTGRNPTGTKLSTTTAANAAQAIHRPMIIVVGRLRHPIGRGNTIVMMNITVRALTLMAGELTNRSEIAGHP